MEIRPTPTEVPDGVKCYVFGSILTDVYRANDIDVLFVYDASKVEPSRIYQVLSPLRSALERCAGRPVHPVVLSTSEAAADGFRERVESVSLRDWLRRFEQSPTGF